MKLMKSKMRLSVACAIICLARDGHADSIYHYSTGNGQNNQEFRILNRLNTDTGEIEAVSGNYIPEASIDSQGVPVLADDGNLYSYRLGGVLQRVTEESEGFEEYDQHSFQRVVAAYPFGDQIIIVDGVANQSVYTYHIGKKETSLLGTYTFVSMFDPIEEAFWGIKPADDGSGGNILERLDVDTGDVADVATFVFDDFDASNLLLPIRFVSAGENTFYFAGLQNVFSRPYRIYRSEIINGVLQETGVRTPDWPVGAFNDPRPYATEDVDVLLVSEPRLGPDYLLRRFEFSEAANGSINLPDSVTNGHQQSDGTIRLYGRAMARVSEGKVIEEIKVYTYNTDLGLVDQEVIIIESGREDPNARFIRGEGPEFPSRFVQLLSKDVSVDGRSVFLLFERPRVDNQAQGYDLYTVDVESGDRSVTFIEPTFFPLEDGFLGQTIPLAPDPARGPSPEEYGFHLSGIKKFDETTEHPDRNLDNLIDTGDLQTRRNELENQK